MRRVERLFFRSCFDKRRMLTYFSGAVDDLHCKVIVGILLLDEVYTSICTFSKHFNEIEVFETNTQLSFLFLSIKVNNLGITTVALFGSNVVLGKIRKIRVVGLYRGNLSWLYWYCNLLGGNFLLIILLFFIFILFNDLRFIFDFFGVF